MARGGKRDGAGRKTGAIQRVSAEARARAAETGELPHEFLLRVSRGGKVDKHNVSFAERVVCAQAAAPYFAPKLASTELSGPNGGPIPIGKVERVVIDPTGNAEDTDAEGIPAASETEEV